MRRHNIAAALSFAAAIALAAPSVLAAEEQAAGDPVVAVVDGQEIRRSQVEEVRQSLPQLRQVPLDLVYGELLEHVITTELLTTKAREAGLADDPEVKRRLAQIEEQLLQQSYLARQVDEALTEERLKKAYEDFLAKNPGQEEVHARHILLETEEQARAVIEEVQGGAAFEEVAKEKSTGPSASAGGDLGYFAKDDMVQPFADAAFALDKGEVSAEPVQTQFGWHVIKVEDRRMSDPPSFEEMRQQLRRDLAEEVAQEAVERLRAEADITRFGLDGEPLEAGDAPQAE